MEFTPTILTQVAVSGGLLELVEWRWPDMIEYCLAEQDLMLEMSLPPYATDASAEFPVIAPGSRCFMGTLFVRYPGIVVQGRGEGGRIRVVRCVFSPEVAASILRHDGPPPLDFLQALLDMRSDSLRTLMRLMHRELTNEVDRSTEALDAVMKLIVVELRRYFERQRAGQSSGRLAAWQYRRIRERLAAGGDLPTAKELADLCGISTRHLHRQFLALTGNTISRYIENFWIEKAKEMLATPDLPVKAVAFACGFSHANSFSRAFRRATGLSPNLFRQRLARDAP